MKVQDIPIKDIVIKENHRLNINETSINELMQSIKEHGLEQPIGVHKGSNGSYELAFGARRLLAFQKLGYGTIPATVGDKIDMKKLLLLNITENLQRKDPSYIEFGRAIEKLTKMDMTEPEIAARLGIPGPKVAMILNTFKKLPAKHLKNVEFVRKGFSTPKGKISAHSAVQIIKIKKTYGLKDENVESLIDSIKKDEISSEDLRNLAVILKTGISFKEALEKMYDYYVYRLDIVVEKSEIGKALKEEQLTSAQLLMKRIIYGKAKPIKKPDFVKI